MLLLPALVDSHPLLLRIDPDHDAWDQVQSFCAVSSIQMIRCRGLIAALDDVVDIQTKCRHDTAERLPGFLVGNLDAVDDDRPFTWMPGTTAEMAKDLCRHVGADDDACIGVVAKVLDSSVDWMQSLPECTSANILPGSRRAKQIAEVEDLITDILRGRIREKEPNRFDDTYPEDAVAVNASSAMGYGRALSDTKTVDAIQEAGNQDTTAATMNTVVLGTTLVIVFGLLLLTRTALSWLGEKGIKWRLQWQDPKSVMVEKTMSLSSAWTKRGCDEIHHDFPSTKEEQDHLSCGNRSSLIARPTLGPSNETTEIGSFLAKPTKMSFGAAATVLQISHGHMALEWMHDKAFCKPTMRKEATRSTFLLRKLQKRERGEQSDRCEELP